MHVSRLEISGELVNLWTEAIDEAFDSDQWDAIKHFNGCSVVQDYFHPCPACFIHDYSWCSGHGGQMADRIFYHLMRSEGMSKGKSSRRWFAVRVGWFCFYLWKYISKRKFRKPTPAMIKIDNYFKNK
jgi:hypothetical protein